MSNLLFRNTEEVWKRKVDYPNYQLFEDGLSQLFLRTRLLKTWKTWPTLLGAMADSYCRVTAVSGDSRSSIVLMFPLIMQCRQPCSINQSKSWTRFLKHIIWKCVFLKNKSIFFIFYADVIPKTSFGEWPRYKVNM